LIIIYLK